MQRLESDLKGLEGDQNKPTSLDDIQKISEELAEILLKNQETIEEIRQQLESDQYKKSRESLDQAA